MKVSEGTVSARLKDLMIRREILTEPMSSKAIADTYYRITGKRLPVSYVNQYLQPFQDRGIIRREMVAGKIRWYGIWQPPSANSEGTMYDQLIRNRRIRKASRGLFMDRHYASAIFEACKTLEVMVKEKTKDRLTDLGKRRLVGQPLMAEVFNEDAPILRINSGQEDEDFDEQAGFKFLFMGMMRGVRDPKGHGQIPQNDPLKTLQYLALADLLARRIDEAALSPT